MKQRDALSQRYAAVLAYVVEHPGTTTRQAADALEITMTTADRSLKVLYVKRLVGRQLPMRGWTASATWYCEPKGAALAAENERTTT